MEFDFIKLFFFFFFTLIHQRPLNSLVRRCRSTPIDGQSQWLYPRFTPTVPVRVEATLTAPCVGLVFHLRRGENGRATPLTTLWRWIATIIEPTKGHSHPPLPPTLGRRAANKLCGWFFIFYFSNMIKFYLLKF